MSRLRAPFSVGSLETFQLVKDQRCQLRTVEEDSMKHIVTASPMENCRNVRRQKRRLSPRYVVSSKRVVSLYSYPDMVAHGIVFNRAEETKSPPDDVDEEPACGINQCMISLTRPFLSSLVFNPDPPLFYVRSTTAEMNSFVSLWRLTGILCARACVNATSVCSCEQVVNVYLFTDERCNPHSSFVSQLQKFRYDRALILVHRQIVLSVCILQCKIVFRYIALVCSCTGR